MNCYELCFANTPKHLNTDVRYKRDIINMYLKKILIYMGKLHGVSSIDTISPNRSRNVIPPIVISISHTLETTLEDIKGQ